MYPNKPLFYILKNKQPVPVESDIEWVVWMASARATKCVVKYTELPGGIRISTDFVGISPTPYSDPILFETMIFGGEHDRYQKSYATWEEAEAGHQEAIELVFA